MMPICKGQNDVTVVVRSNGRLIMSDMLLMTTSKDVLTLDNSDFNVRKRQHIRMCELKQLLNRIRYFYSSSSET